MKKKKHKNFTATFPAAMVLEIKRRAIEEDRTVCSYVTHLIRKDVNSPLVPVIMDDIK